MAVGNIFSIPPGDKSIYYLGQIFGNMGYVLDVGTVGGFLGMLFKAINTVALTVGALVLVYITVVGLLATAHKGEFLGKKWSGLWVPIRTVLGVASLFPAANGYSAIQVIIMWIIVQGIGAADLLWGYALQYVTVQSPYPSSSFVNIQNAQVAIQGFYQGVVCQQTLAQQGPTSIKNVPYQNSITPTPFPTSSNIYNLANGQCGTLTMCDPNSSSIQSSCQDTTDTESRVTCAACTAQRPAMAEVYQFLNGWSQGFAQDDLQYVTFYLDQAAPADWIEQACQDKGIDKNNCCVSSGTDVTNTCKVQSGSTDWPYPYTPDSGSTPGNGTDVPQAALSFYETYKIYPDLLHTGAPVDTLTNTQAQSIDFISIATQQYANAINTAVSAAIQAGATSPPSTGWQSDAYQFGWITAGSYYYEIVKIGSKTISGADPALAFQPPATFPSYRNNYNGFNNLVTNIQKAYQSPSTGSSLQAPDQVNQVTNYMNNSSAQYWNDFKNAIKPSTSGNMDPLYNIAAYGQNLMMGAQILYATVPIIAAVTTGLGSLSFVAIGTGPTQSVTGTIFSEFFSFFKAGFFLIVGAMMSFGAMLGIYIPLIPYMIFTASVVGWFIGTIEAIAAAPFVALGIMGPGGQHELLGRAEPTIMIVFNLFLRPALMVLGLMAAMLLAGQILNLINWGYGSVIDSIDPSAGLIEQYVFIAAYVALLFGIMNKIFALIHLVPERVLTYVGGHAIQYGEGEVVGGAKHGVEAMAAGAAAGFKAGGEHAPGAVTAIKAASDKEREGSGTMTQRGSRGGSS